MKFLIEDADIDRIRRCFEYWPINGVSIDPAVELDEIKRVRELIGEDCELHVPIVSSDADRIVDEAQRLTEELGSGTYVKIPVGREGFKAMKALELSRVSFVAVGVCTPIQALVAGNCGASYVAPFVNRLDSRNAVAIVKSMHEALKRNALETEVIAAGFKNSRQAIELCEYGLGAVIVSTDMLSSMIEIDH